MLLDPPKYNDVVVGNDFTVCELCAANHAHEKHIMKQKAIRELTGTFVGKYFLKIGDLYICEDCLSKAIADIALKKKQVKDYKQTVGDDVIESLNDIDESDDTKPSEVTVVKKPTKSRSKKAEA